LKEHIDAAIVSGRERSARDSHWRRRHWVPLAQSAQRAAAAQFSGV